MNIKKIIRVLKDNDLFVDTNANLNLDFKHISYNSLDIVKDTLFCCKGFNFKIKYLEEALEKGATCYISSKKFKDVDAYFILVNDIRKAIAVIGKLFYKGYENLYKIGITGTKGKTTTVYFLHNILNKWQEKNTAYISTIDYYTGKSSSKSYNTTPDSLELLKMFDEVESSKLKYIVMEVSSQAVKLDRIHNLTFDIGAFLNIDYDHISPTEHEDFDDYLNCKLAFLKECNNVILYRDINNYNYIRNSLKNKNIITFGFNEDSFYKIKNINRKNNITEFEIEYEGKLEKYAINMLGKFNCINACCSIIIAKMLNISYENIISGLLETNVPGRMMTYYKGNIPIIVDFAHNKLSIETLFRTIEEEFPNSNLKVVVGCPGNKALNRRSEIGSLCEKYASYTYLTSDDPGFEDVKEICKTIAFPIKKGKYEIEEDRKKTIEKAILELKENDVLAIIGKGHEEYQLVLDKYLKYETDGKIVENKLKKIGGLF